MPSLPIDGQTNWGDPLNAYIAALQNEANSTQANLNTHASNTPADPHGDRAYAQGLVNPIINGVNLPNGFVQLNSQGLIPSSLISGGGGNNVTGGMYSGIFDAVATFGAVPNNGADQSAHIQNALNAAGSAGGGVVWVGPGVFSMANYVVMPSNTWLMMSEGTTLQRIPGSPNAKYLISNVQFGTSNTPSSDVRITGGTLDAVGSSMTSQCTPIFLIQSSKNRIQDVFINNVYSNPAIEINGCTNTIIDSCFFDGTGSNNIFSGGSTAPAVRINVSAASTTPSGLANTFYNNTVSTNTRVMNCNTQSTGFSFGCYGALVGDDFSNSNHSKNIFVTGCSTMYASSLGSGVVSNGQFSGLVNANNLFV